MTKIRDKAKEILDGIPKQPITSDGKTADLFTKYTGTSHATLKTNWDGGGIMTACNGFTGWYGSQLGSKTYLGGFDLEGILKKVGKANAWVKSVREARPQFGDICRHTAFHVGVSLDFDGDKWNHIDAGQGGKAAGHDILVRSQSKNAYDFTKLAGWIDIDDYFSDFSSTGTVPAWLPGWWRATLGGQEYFYYFDQSWRVKWTSTKPNDTAQAPVLASDTGSVGANILGGITIRWDKTANTEKYAKQAGDDKAMQGTWNDTDPMTASKL